MKLALLLLVIYLGLTFIFEIMKASAKTRKSIAAISIIQTIWMALSFFQFLNVYDKLHSEEATDLIVFLRISLILIGSAFLNGFATYFGLLCSRNFILPVISCLFPIGDLQNNIWFQTIMNAMEPLVSKLASYLPESFECNPIDQNLEVKGEKLIKEEASIAS